MAGWRERVHLPDQDLHLNAKLDTGARTSALDALGPRPFDRDGVRWCRFTVPLPEPVDVEAPLVDVRWVKDSGGHGSLRPVVTLDVAMGGTQWTIESTLAVREGMTHRMLLGRSALRGRFAVDPARVDLLCPLRRAAGA